jgi:uroporphyrinogen decarboxylase
MARGFALTEESWADWTLPDGTPCKIPAWALPQREDGRWVFRSKSGRRIAHMPEGALYFEQAYFPFADENGPKTIPEAMQESMWHVMTCPPGPWVDFAQLREGAQKLRQNTDKAILGGFGGNLLEAGQFLYRNDNFFMLLAGEPQKAHKFLDGLIEIYMPRLEKFLGAVGEYIDIIRFGDDLGMQSGPQVSPRMYREFFKPRQKLMWGRAKQLANVKVMLHCCGGVRELLPDLIDAGLEAINPVQISCKGMDARELKAEFGKEMVFWGGSCDTQTILPYATPEAVRRHVREQVEILSPGGGFVHQQVHNILADVPPQNIVAMYEALHEGGAAGSRS